MLRAYVDDSAHQQQPPLFILAGYIAQADQWTEFATEWQRALDLPPRIAYFKLREAIRKEGEFYGRPHEITQQKYALFRAIVERYVHAEFGVCFRLDHYREVFGRIRGPLKNPFYFALLTLVGDVARSMDKLGLAREPIDFIFDNRVIEKEKLLDGWHQMLRYLGEGDDPDGVLSIVFNPPSFQDDKEVLPLQAADMHATMVRLDVTQSEPMFGIGRRIRGLMLAPQKRDFNRFLYGILEQYAPEELAKAKAESAKRKKR